jgi:pheromone shutdown-related protein TraB
MIIKYKNLVIVGTSHIAKESITEVEQSIEKEKPIFVALELDNNRYNSLISGEQRDVSYKYIKEIGFGGYLLLKIGHYIETKLGLSIGSTLGGEMIKAADTASKYNCKIVLIDQEIKKTLKNFSENFNWKEKLKIILDIMTGLIKKEKIKIDLKRVPDKDIIILILDKLKKRYPGIYKSLVQDRNIYMAKRLSRLMELGNIVAVIGAGHVEGIIEEIKRIENNKNKIDRIGI